jgi:2-keto-4-pentenoate hydratase/2-oxohepta-3-ene-1,7-dioic acid hydratase in catechol pathway
MRLVTFRSEKGDRPGLVVGERVVDLPQAIAGAKAQGLVGEDVAIPNSLLDVIAGGADLRRACETVLGQVGSDGLAAACSPLAGVTLLAPIPRPAKNVFCVGSNYRAHVTESSRAQDKKDVVPEYPVFFTKPPTAVIGPGDVIRLDPSVSEKMDYEVELGVVIGKAGRNIPAAAAMGHVFGFTIINDITARDLQRRHGGQFLKGKGLDGSCPMGPQIVTIDELDDFDDLAISLTVNGETRQDGNTGSMIFTIPRLLESLSEGLTLEPGDLLATGTPSGVGYAMDPPSFLQDGDLVSCALERIGELTNTVRDVSKVASVA